MKFSCLSFLSWLLSFRMHRGEPRKRRRTRNGFGSGRGPGWALSLSPLCLCGFIVRSPQEELTHRDTEGTEKYSGRRIRVIRLIRVFLLLWLRPKAGLGFICVQSVASDPASIDILRGATRNHTL